MKSLCALLICFIITSPAFTQPKISFEEITNGLSRPVDLVNANDGSKRLFIVEETGKIKIWDGSKILIHPFLDLTDTIKFKGESGLLSITFHPDYKNNRYFFVYYVNKNNDITIARYRTLAGHASRASQTSEKILLHIHKNNTNHYGGRLNFGRDGYLYFATGDSGGAGDPENAAQDGMSLLGKFIRIDVNNFSKPPYYTIPADNPYNSKEVRREIIGLGLRNPFNWSFDRLNGNIWLADVGQDAWEEVNFLYYNSRLKHNFGWNCFEGTHVYAGCPAKKYNKLPIFQYAHDSTGGLCIIGGYVYRGSKYPSLYGYYICSDYVSNNGWLIKNKSGTFQATKQKNWPATIVAYGEAEDGELYASSLTGSLYKVKAGAATVTEVPIAKAIGMKLEK